MKRMWMALLLLGLTLSAGEVIPADRRIAAAERGPAALTPQGCELSGVNMEAVVEYEFASGVRIDAIEVTTLGNGHLFLAEAAVSADRVHWRPLLGRMVNLPSQPDTERVALPPASVGRYWRLTWRAGTFVDPALPVGVAAIRFEGEVNRPERHMLCWTHELDEYAGNIDYLADDIGVTDLWLGSVASASQQSQLNQGFGALAGSGALEALRARGIRYWLNEHETVNGMMTPEKLRDDLAWRTFNRQVRSIYPQLRELGFRGVVFDAEDYNPMPEEVRARYERELGYTDHASSWGFFEEYGRDGAYYRRGNDFGRIFKEAWPEGIFMQLYEARLYAGKPGSRDGNYWWLSGIADAGVEVWIATEKTYGAGHDEITGVIDHLHHWFVDMNVFLPEIFQAFPMASRVLPGFHPWNVRLARPLYRPEYLDEQLKLARDLTPALWIYTEGSACMGDPRRTLDPQICREAGVTPEAYLEVFRSHPTPAGR